MTNTDLQNWQDIKAGFKWPVAVAHTIAASAEKVWDVIAMPGNLEQCHPFCDKNPVIAWPGDEAHDEIHYLSGWVFERRFFRWIDGFGYDLEIGTRGGTTSLVRNQFGSHPWFSASKRA